MYIIRKPMTFFHYLCYIKRSLDNFKRYIFKLFNFVLVSIESVVDAKDWNLSLSNWSIHLQSLYFVVSYEIHIIKDFSIYVWLLFLWFYLVPYTHFPIAQWVLRLELNWGFCQVVHGLLHFRVAMELHWSALLVPCIL